MPSTLLYLAIAVFSLMVIGLALTVHEFSKFEKNPED